MGTIRILNKHHLKCDDPEAIYIGRGSALGNPYTVEKYGRTVAIELYKDWLKQQVLKGNPQVIDQLDKIAQEVIHKGHAKLLCFCAPRPCHGDHIAATVLKAIKQGTPK